MIIDFKNLKSGLKIVGKRVGNEISMNSYKAAINAQNKIKDLIKKAYLDSSNYYISEVTDGWAKRRKGGDGKKALYNTGQLMRNVTGGKITKSIYAKGVGYNIGVHMKDSPRSDSSLSNARLAAVHEKKRISKDNPNKRDLWTRVWNAHKEDIIEDIQNDIANL